MDRLKQLFSGGGDDGREEEEDRDPTQRVTRSQRKRGRDSEKAEPSEAEFQEFLSQLTSQVETPFEPATVRNILLVGVTRSGKTTLLNVLTTPGYVNTSPDVLVSGTVNARMHTFAVKKATGTFVAINIVDTPGLFEIARAGEVARPNEKIASVILDCLQNELTKIHRVFFCFSKNIGLAAPNVESINILLRDYPAFVGKCSLIVTHCEDETAESLVQLEKHLRQDAPIKGLDKMPVFFTGSIGKNQVLRKNKSEVSRQFQQTQEFRRMLIGHILNECEEPMKLDAVMKFTVYNEQANAAARELKEKIPQLSGITLKDTNFYQRVQEVMTTFFRLLDNPLAHQFRGELAAEFRTFETMIESDPKIQQMLE